MADSIAAYLANKWLGMLGGTAFTAPASVWIALHTGDPGTAGTSNASSVTTREQVTFAAASGGAIASNNTPTWPTWAGTNGEVVTDISLWDASASGNFLDSIQLSSPVTLYTGDTLEITSLSISFPTAS